MRLKANMIKGKAVYGLLVLILAVVIVTSPFPAIKTAEASTSVANVWVELSDDTVLNSTSTALEYIIHFTTTTALTGGVDTITVTFPDGTTAMAGEEGTGYAFDLPSSIAATYVAVDPDGAATTTIGYTDCYSNPYVGTYRVRLTLPMDIAAGASPYIKFETGAAITSASTKGTTYRVKVETSQDTAAVYSEYFSLGGTDTAVTSVGHLSGYPNPATVGSAAEYKFEFTTGASGALSAGSGTITVIFPSGTTVPASASKEMVQVDADGSGTSYSLTACTVDPTCHSDSRTVTLTVPQAVAKNTEVYVYFAQGFGLVNPATSSSTAKVKIYTSAEPKYVVATNTLFGVWGSGTSDVFAAGYYDDDTMRHYDGSSWSEMTSNTPNDLHGVWGGGASDVFAVGHNGTIIHYASSWSAQTSGTTNNLYGVWGDGSDDVFAVGYGGTILYSANNGSTWTSQTSGTTNNLHGVWGTAVSDVFAVGASGTIRHYASSWSSQTSGTTKNLYGVWGSSSTDIFAVGASGTIVHYVSSWSSQVSGTANTLYSVGGTTVDSTDYVFAVGASGTILYSADNGTTWTSQTSGTTKNLYGVWVTSADSTVYAYAVGASGTILYYNGTSWSEMDSDTTHGYSITADTATKLGFANVSGAYSDDVTMINMYSSTIYLQLQDQYGNRKAPSHDLTVGLSSTSDTGKFYSAVDSEISSATIYDGTGDPSGTTAGQFSLLYKDSVAGAHTITASVPGYDSASWMVTVVPAVSVYDSNNSLVNTYAPTFTSPVAEGDGFYGGDYLQNAVSDALPGETVKLGDGIYEIASGITVAKPITLESGNGASFTTLRPIHDLTGVWGNSTSDVYAVGYGGTIFHYNGTSWSSQTSGTTNNLYGVWGTSVTVDSVTTVYVFAVGASGTILYSSDDGSTWTSQTSGTTNNLYSVWVTSADSTVYVFVVGASGTILYSSDKGSTWTSMTSNTTNTLYSVEGSGTSDVFAVGASGTILHYNGTSWSSQSSGTTKNLYGVWDYNSSNVFAVGASGTILYSTGSGSWTAQTSGTSNKLYSVWGTASDNVFAVGVSGTILKYSDSSWSSLTSGTTYNLRGIGGSGASDVFAVGAFDIILHSADGSSWSSQTSPTATVDKAINITATGSATYGVTIDGITFDRLRSNTVFNYGIYNSYADYITVQNCVFNYIYNRGIMLTSTNATFTSGTISNNTFSNGGGSSVAGTDAAIDITAATNNYDISGITISGNTITDQKGKGIYLDGCDSDDEVSSVSITSNTITSATSYGIQGYDAYIDTIAITSNTITGCYEDGIYVKGTAYTIKKNVVTGNLGDGIDVEYTSASHLINYNDIYDNTGYGVNVLLGVSTVDTKYNWWGSATGPTYTAATGANVDVSNPEGTGENITDRVTYYEWLYKPIADVIADNAAYYTRVVNLSVGWNTLSTPIILDASGDTVDEVVDSAKITIAYWYDTNDADADGTYWEQVTTGYELEPCDAIYIKMNATDSVILKYNAIDISMPTKDLYAGWNLIGLANLETKHVDDAVQSVANTPTNLPGYSQVVSPSMNSSDWTFSSGQSYTDEDMLVGEGYWIYMQNDCTLVGFTITPLQPSLD